jgi:hypothetical protein
MQLSPKDGWYCITASQNMPTILIHPFQCRVLPFSFFALAYWHPRSSLQAVGHTSRPQPEHSSTAVPDPAPLSHNSLPSAAPPPVPPPPYPPPATPVETASPSAYYMTTRSPFSFANSATAPCAWWEVAACATFSLFAFAFAPATQATSERPPRLHAPPRSPSAAPPPPSPLAPSIPLPISPPMHPCLAHPTAPRYSADTRSMVG